jgi:hypothetical protein
MNKYTPFIIFAIIIITGFLVVRADHQNQNLDLPVLSDNEVDNQIPNNLVEKPPITTEFIQCLNDAGVVIYGSQTCPACARLVGEYGGYEIIKPIYLDCSGLGSPAETTRCKKEMKTMYVPEIQINGELFNGWGTPEAIAEVTGCQI